MLFKRLFHYYSTCRTCNNRFINGFKNSRTVFSSSRLCENTGSDDSDDKTSDSKKKETLQKLQNLLQVMTKVRLFICIMPDILVLLDYSILNIFLE